MRPRFAALLVCASVALLLGAAAVPARAADPPRLRVQGGAQPAIVDEDGRQVLLRGVNVNQLGDYFQYDPAQPTVFPLTAEDFEGIRRLGFNSVRLVLNWSAFQPQRGAFDAGYLARVRAAVASARSRGLYVVLDMHQDAWGKFIASRPGETCAPGFGPAVGWDGAPGWATLTDGLSNCRAADTRELSPSVAQAFQSFYADRDEIQSELIRTWARLAAAFARDPAIAGYDLFNEPHPGFLVGPDQSAALGRYYARAIEAIRAAERGAGGFAHIAFFEPSVVWSGFGADAVPPPGFTPDTQISFAPHLYAESITVDQRAGISSVSIEQGFEYAERAAATYGAPLWSGEWGWFGTPQADLPKLERYAREEDRRRVGGAWWVWRQACGDPHLAGAPSLSGSLNRYACPGDRPLGLNEAFARVLTRAYPRHAPGRLVGLTSDPRSERFAVRGSARDGGSSCRLEVWVPDRGRGEPALAGTGVSDLAVKRVEGGWLATACARGDYELRGEPGAASAAAARRCTSRRVIRLRIRTPRGFRLRGARVRVSGVRPRRVRVRGRRVVLDLRGSAAGRVVVRIDARSRGGRRYAERRAFRTCARRARRG